MPQPVQPDFAAVGLDDAGNDFEQGVDLPQPERPRTARVSSRGRRSGLMWSAMVLLSKCLQMSVSRSMGFRRPFGESGKENGGTLMVLYCFIFLHSAAKAVQPKA